MVDTNTIEFKRLQDNHIIKPFDCGNEDLNNFLFNDAKDYQSKHLAVTYILENEDHTIAFFSLVNDKISVSSAKKATWRRIKHRFEHSKHRKDYPAVKIGRFAVDKRYQRSSLGSHIVDFIKSLYSHKSQAGCAFITVDALKSAVPFYVKNNFKHLDNSETNQPTSQLYFDINSLIHRNISD